MNQPHSFALTLGRCVEAHMCNIIGKKREASSNNVVCDHIVDARRNIGNFIDSDDLIAVLFLVVFFLIVYIKKRL